MVNWLELYVREYEQPYITPILYKQAVLRILFAL